jgi:hypothetical protein
MDADLTRRLLAEVERKLTELDESNPSDLMERVAVLRESWLRLVEHLALGPAPLVRRCPACNGTIMQAATRCLHCWTKSMPPADAAGPEPEKGA